MMIVFGSVVALVIMAVIIAWSGLGAEYSPLLFIVGAAVALQWFTKKGVSVMVWVWVAGTMFWVASLVAGGSMVAFLGELFYKISRYAFQ